MSATYTVSQAAVKRYRRSPCVAAMTFGTFAALFGYAKSMQLSIAILSAVIAGGLLGFLKFRESRRFLDWAPTHRLEINESGLLIRDGQATSQLPYGDIDKVVVNGRSDDPKSVVLVRGNGVRERLPPYGDLAQLVSELARRVGLSRVSYRRLIHF